MTMEGRIHSIESFGLVDGPGVRCVVFLKGCRMRCRYCHNPDTWQMEGGTLMTPDAMFEKIIRFKPYWGKGGGVTDSGGEPLLQIEFVTELFRRLKKDGIHTAIDTAGQPFRDDPEWMAKFEQLMAVTDLVILDIKEIDPDKHKALTRQPNANILAMARWLSDHGMHMWIRHVLVPGLTDDEEGLRQTHEFIESLKTVDLVEILPYHTLGLAKWEDLGVPYTLEGIEPPSREQVKKAEQILEVAKYREKK